MLRIVAGFVKMLLVHTWVVIAVLGTALAAAQAIGWIAVVAVILAATMSLLCSD